VTNWRPRLAARYESDAMHRITSSILRWDAAETESPTPVPSAIYAAMHIGHFGNSASTVPGTIHRAISRPRRANDGVRGSLFAVRAANDLAPPPIGSVSQQ